MSRSRYGLVALLCLGLATAAQGAPLILNEYNAVGSTDFLNGGDPNADVDGGFASDSYFGRVAGNGGDWFELVVVAFSGEDRLVVVGTPFQPELVIATLSRVGSAWKIVRVDRGIAEP